MERGASARQLQAAARERKLTPKLEEHLLFHQEDENNGVWPKRTRKYRSLTGTEETKTDLTKTPKWNKSVQVKRERDREREVCIEMDGTRAVQNSHPSNPYLSLPHRKWQRDHKIKKLWKSTKIINCILSFFKAGFFYIKNVWSHTGPTIVKKRNRWEQSVFISLYFGSV